MDTICVVPVFPPRTSKIHMSEVRVEAGGQVATALTTCARFGLTARYIGSVGTDSWGKAQLASLREENLELHVREVDGAASQDSGNLNPGYIAPSAPMTATGLPR